MTKIYMRIEETPHDLSHYRRAWIFSMVTDPSGGLLDAEDARYARLEKRLARLESALDRRKGPADRRKVRDYAASSLRDPRYGRWKACGRRATDKTDWRDLPLSEPPIPVSEGMEQAAVDCANRLGELIPYHFRDYYRAMRRAEMEEQKKLMVDNYNMGQNPSRFVRAPYGALGSPIGPFYSHRRKGEENCTRVGHRRKDDP